MTISKADVDRFKKAFKGKVAAKDTPLLAHQVKLPDSVGSSDRLKKALEALEGKLDQMSIDARSKRTGTRALGSAWTKDSKSSLKKAADVLDEEQVDLDLLEGITQGKGQAEAQAALNELKQAEKAIQSAVADELLDQATQTVDPHQSALRVRELLAFLAEPGVSVPNAYDEAVLRVATVLGSCLKERADWAKTATPDQIREAYLDKLYGKLKMDSTAARDPGALKPLSDNLTTLDRLDPTLLTPGSDAETIYRNMKAAKIGDNISLNGSRAGKFSTGTQESRKKSVPATGGKSAEMAFDGNQRFVKGVEDSLSAISKTSAGQALMDAFAQTGSPLKIQAPSIANAKKIAPDGSMIYANSASNGVVSFDPENNVAIDGADSGKADSEPWRQREASIALYHEMIHALIAKKGGEDFVSPDDVTATLHLGDQGDITELRIVGIDYVDQKDGKSFRYPFSDPKYNPITENAYRRALAKSKGEKEVYLRPSYANVVGQVPLKADKVKV